MMKNENRAGKAVLAFLRVVLLVLGVSAAAYAESASGDILAGYPADYPIAWLDTLGYTSAPTVRELFGPTAPFVKSLYGLPVEITIDSVAVSGTNLSVVLMLKAKVLLVGPIDMIRMELGFQSDSKTKRSYLRQLKIVNRTQGDDVALDIGAQNGDDEEDIHRFFAEDILAVYWDTQKLKKAKK